MKCSNKHRHGKIYKCPKCSNKLSIKNGNKWLMNFELEFNQILKCIMLWITKPSMKILNNAGIYLNYSTYAKFCVILLFLFEETKIGGENVAVEIDTMAIYDKKLISNRKLISIPDDNIQQWIVGGIQTSGEMNFFLRLVKIFPFYLKIIYFFLIEIFL